MQNQLQSAMRKLPQAVQDQGVTVRKTGDTNILTIAFVSTDRFYGQAGYRRLRRQ
nr:Multidrug resistance protein mexB Multidrug-efflux transporter mexB [Salmonella sp. NCTC 7297]